MFGEKQIKITTKQLFVTSQISRNENAGQYPMMVTAEEVDLPVTVQAFPLPFQEGI